MGGGRLRILAIAGLAVLVVALGFRMRVMVAGGKAVLVIAVILVLTWLALAPKRSNEG